MGDDLTDLVDLSSGKAKPGEDVLCDRRPLYLLVLALSAAVFLFGQRDADVVENGRGDDNARSAPSDSRRRSAYSVTLRACSILLESVPKYASISRISADLSVDIT